MYFSWKLYTNGNQLLGEKGEKKLLTDFIRSYFPNCFLVLSANIYQLHLFTGKLSNNCTYNPKRTFSSPYAKKYVSQAIMCEIKPPLHFCEEVKA